MEKVGTLESVTDLGLDKEDNIAGVGYGEGDTMHLFVGERKPPKRVRLVAYQVKY